MKLILVVSLIGVFCSQASNAHEGRLNAADCHLQVSDNKYHCHRNGDFQLTVKKKTSFSGPENQAPQRRVYEKKLVQKIQAHLNSLGYAVGVADGVYGRKTQTAIQNFQKDNGFRLTGAPSEYVLSKLRDVKKAKQ